MTRPSPLRLSVALALGLALGLLAPTAFGHGGGLDGYGCHHNRKQGGYHCHRGEHAGKHFASQAEMLQSTRGKTKDDQGGGTKPDGRRRE